jgi:NAD(P)-dependent dehydrogenase (short-subunit alcohol dehydrogenase family)
MDLHDRVALITGASGGLVAVTARMLADHGVHVAVTHLGHRDEAVELCRQIEEKERKAFLVHLDQTDPASCRAAVEATVNALGRLDILMIGKRYGVVPGRVVDVARRSTACDALDRHGDVEVLAVEKVAEGVQHALVHRDAHGAARSLAAFTVAPFHR